VAAAAAAAGGTAFALVFSVEDSSNPFAGVRVASPSTRTRSKAVLCWRAFISKLFRHAGLHCIRRGAASEHHSTCAALPTLSEKRSAAVAGP